MPLSTYAPELAAHHARQCLPRRYDATHSWVYPVFLGLLLAAIAKGESPFAARVLSYAPAPGPWVNNRQFNNPASALGRPHAGGVGEPDHSSLVSLGGYGGSITLAFDHTVLDEPLNPWGMDAIVFSNAFWPAPEGTPDASLHWAECATIEISLDRNGNGLADDPWYLIPGSHIPDPAGQLARKTWDDDIDDATFPPAERTWIPAGLSGTWQTQAYELPFDVFGPPIVENPSLNPALEGIFGYAEYTPTLLLGDLDADGEIEDSTATPESFYTVPDDPRRVGITPGAGGGDAFDVAWAVDPSTGERARLPGFDFIRLTTAVYVFDPEAQLSEKSAEIDAVADVAPDPFGDADEDGDRDLIDVALLQLCFQMQEALTVPCSLLDYEPDGSVDRADVAALMPRLTGPFRARDIND